MRVTASDGVTLEVAVTGQGPGMVLLHGFGGAKADFSDHWDAFARHHRLVVFDQRGHGDAGGPPDPERYSFERLAADVLEIATAVGLPRFRVVGTSLGGMVAQEVVLAAPERVEALVLSATGPAGVAGVDPERARRAGELALEIGMPALRQRAAGSDDPLATPAHAWRMAQRPGHQEFEDWKFDVQVPAMYAAMIRHLVDRPDRLAALAATVACPVLVVVGEQDRVFGGESRRLAEALPTARLVVLPDAGHNPQLETPAAWREAVETFLEDLARPGDPVVAR